MASAALGGAIAAFKHVAGDDGKQTIRERTLAEQLEMLEAEMEVIQDFLKNGDKYGYLEIDGVAYLLKEIETFAYAVQDRIESFVLVLSSKHECFDWYKIGLRRGSAAFKFAPHLQELVIKAREIVELLGRYWKKVLPAPLCSTIPRSSIILERRKHFLYHNVEETKIIAFEQHIKTLVDRLLKDADHSENGIISIVGMGGIGKTTLAKEVYKSVRHQFDCSAMIYVSEIPNTDELLHDLAEEIGLNEEQRQGSHLEANLCAYFSDKRYLILLDDIWDLKAWNSLSISNPNRCKTGSRIIITSHNRELDLQTGWDSYCYELQPLNENDSWNLFSNLVIEPLKPSRELVTLGHEIVKRCGGVPLAIVSVADLLLRTAKNGNEWQNVIDNMGRDGSLCSNVLALSYDYLPAGLKSCFLYFGLFPKDYDLFASDIINQWTSEGLVLAQGLREPEDVGEDYLNHLAANSMIQVSSRTYDGKIRTFRIHELIHSFCIWMTTKTVFFNPHGATVLDPGVRRATISNWGKIPMSSSTLRTVVCSDKGFSVQEGTKDFFKGSELLQVLTVGSKQLPYCLTKGLGNLKLLKYLGCIDHSLLPLQVKLPSTLSKLRELMTLDLRNVNYETVPEGIWKLRQLRHLLLRKLALCESRIIDARAGKQKSSRKIKVNLPYLQTLYVVPGQFLQPEMLQTSAQLRKLGIDSPNDTVIDLISKSEPICKKLEILWLRCHPVKRTTKVNLSQYLHLRRLHLNTETVPKYEELPPNLVKLVLFLQDLKEDPMQALSKLRKLKTLKLYVNKCNMDNIVCSGGPDAFSELEVMELYLPFYVRKLTVEEHAMPKLMKVSGLSSRILLDIPERMRAGSSER